MKDSQQYEPKIIDNELWGLSLNPMGKFNRNDYDYDSSIAAYENDWNKAESKRQLVRVCESEIERSSATRFWTLRDGFRHQLIQTGETFEADKNDKNELINLKIC